MEHMEPIENYSSDREVLCTHNILYKFVALIMKINEFFLNQISSQRKIGYCQALMTLNLFSHFCL